LLVVLAAEVALMERQPLAALEIHHLHPQCKVTLVDKVLRTMLLTVQLVVAVVLLLLALLV
jgi:cell division protein FtsL